jgi:hypothetical protein
MHVCYERKVQFSHALGVAEANLPGRPLAAGQEARTFL